MSSRPRSLSYASAALGASLALATGGMAHAQSRRPEITQQIPLSPLHVTPFAVPPDAGVLRLAVVELGNHLVDGHRPERAAGRLDASLGFTNILGARLSLPVVGAGRSLGAGSALAAFSYTSVFRLGSVFVRTVLEAGVTLPAAGATWDPAVAVPVAHGELGGVAAGTIIVGHRSGFAVIPWTNLSRGVGAELAFAPAWSPVAVRAGVEVPSARDAPTSFVAGVAMRIARGTELSVFTAVSVDSSASSTAPLLGLGVRLEVPTTHPRSYADAPGDVARVSREQFAGLGALPVAGKVTLVELGAAWCEPCHIAEPYLLALARDEPRLAVRFVDVDEIPQAREGLGRDEIPIFLVISPDGRELGRHVGWNLVAVRRLVADAISR